MSQRKLVVACALAMIIKVHKVAQAGGMCNIVQFLDG